MRSQSAVELALLFGSRARGDHRLDSDADLALIFERGNEWPVLEALAGLAFDVLMDTGGSNPGSSDLIAGLG
jgi:predicted nucleotidyltransferase